MNKPTPTDPALVIVHHIRGMIAGQHGDMTLGTVLQALLARIDHLEAEVRQLRQPPPHQGRP